MGLLLGTAAVWGCSAGSGGPDLDSVSGGTGSSAAPAVAYVAGMPIRGDEFEASLREASGREVLEEIVLDRLVVERLAQRGVTLDAGRLEAERSRLLAALDADPDVGQRLLGDLRERRGLGPARFDRLLRRNAGLRLLVADEVEVSDAAVRRAFDRNHGRRFRVRLLTADTPAAAEALRTRIAAGEPFAAVAAAGSTDASRERGGLLDPIHPDDPTFPAAVRTAAARLAPGELSGVVGLGSGSGYAVLKLEELIPATDASFEAERDGLREAVRTDLERQRMEQLARTLRAEAEVVVLDPSLQPGG